MANRGGTPANLKEPWQKGKSGNPKGRPPMDARIEEMRDKLGDFPRTELMRISRDRRISVETRARVLMHLDDKFTGRAKQSNEPTKLDVVTAVQINIVDPAKPKTLTNGSGT